jgi:hypothetical protein
MKFEKSVEVECDCGISIRRSNIIPDLSKFELGECTFCGKKYKEVKDLGTKKFDDKTNKEIKD